MLLTVEDVLLPRLAREKPMCVTMDTAEPLSHFPVGTGLKIKNSTCKVFKEDSVN